ncbi:MAG: hypothetical protein HZA91_07825 [Verrucomicrobia bacterium]|nr:hypothetical protein [Verrucomicrobiota bacterium]
MRRISINVHIAIAMLVAMLGILSGIVLLGMNENDLVNLYAAQAAGVERARALSRYEHHARRLVDLVHPPFVTMEAPGRQRFESALKELDAAAAMLQAIFRDPHGQQQRLADIHRQLRHWLGEIAGLLGKGDSSPPVREVQVRYEALVTTLRTLEQTLQQVEQRATRTREATLLDAIAGMRETASAVAALVIMSVLVLWWWSISATRRGLRLLEQSLSDAAGGKTSLMLDPGQLPPEFHNVVNAYHGVCQHIVDRSSRHARDMETLNEQLLKGLITICSSCKKIRAERGEWVSIEAYVRSRTTADFTHGLCEECLNKTLNNL